MHADGGAGTAKMAESEREHLSAKSFDSPPPPVMRAVGQLGEIENMEYKDLFVFPDDHPPSPYDKPIMIEKTGRYGFLPNGLSLCAVGWLEKSGFPTGQVSDKCVEALFSASADQVLRDGTRGFHSCTLCSEPDFIYPINWQGQTINVSGYGHYLVQMEKMVFMAPRLILHYILGHNYSPPQEFVQATIHGKFLTEDDLVSRQRE